MMGWVKKHHFDNNAEVVIPKEDGGDKPPSLYSFG
jgi:hypothetical protein